MKSEMPGMKEGESKYGWYAKMYVKMLFGLLSLPFMFQTLGKFDQKCCAIKDVKRSGYSGKEYKRCPKCRSQSWFT
ncbi:MAG: hypothetical protein WBD09_11415 [Halobacteriota archaeon]